MLAPNFNRTTANWGTPALDQPISLTSSVSHLVSEGLTFVFTRLALAFLRSSQNHSPLLYWLGAWTVRQNFLRNNLNSCMSSLYRAQLVSTSLALRTTSYLSVETEYMPWQSALDNLHYYYLMLDRTEVYQPMQVYYISNVCQWQRFALLWGALVPHLQHFQLYALCKPKQCLLINSILYSLQYF